MLINCFIVFCIRIIETMLNTFRTILIIKNNKKMAVVVAFFEIIVWLTAIRKIVSNNFNIYCAVAYALGFSLGTFVAMMITEKFSKNNISVVISFPKTKESIIQYLQKEGYEFLINETKDQYFKEMYLLTLNVQKKKIKELRNNDLFKSKEIEFIITEFKKV